MAADHRRGNNRALLRSLGARRTRQGSPRRPQRSDGRYQGEERHEADSVARCDHGIDGEDAGCHEPEAGRCRGTMVHYGRERTGGRCPCRLEPIAPRRSPPEWRQYRRNPSPPRSGWPEVYRAPQWCRNRAVVVEDLDGDKERGSGLSGAQQRIQCSQ